MRIIILVSFFDVSLFRAQKNSHSHSILANLIIILRNLILGPSLGISSSFHYVHVILILRKAILPQLGPSVNQSDSESLILILQNNFLHSGE